MAKDIDAHPLNATSVVYIRPGNLMNFEDWIQTKSKSLFSKYTCYRIFNPAYFNLQAVLDEGEVTVCSVITKEAYCDIG